mmetsp:Transcript_22059/g.33003  ORF Transcript_22059/g.33003 Transcript_22059/m.33003 type:complete len:91 (+) Transcript_22059:38-310(+)
MQFLSSTDLPERTFMQAQGVLAYTRVHTNSSKESRIDDGSVVMEARNPGHHTESTSMSPSLLGLGARAAAAAAAAAGGSEAEVRQTSRAR